MKSLVIGFCFAALGLAPLVGSAEEALFWCFNNPDMTSWHFTQVKAKDAVDLDGNPYNMNAIRVKAVDGDTSAYLRLYAGDGAGYMDLGDALAMSDNWLVEPLYAGLGDYSRDGVQFMIELGTYAGPDDWTAYAYSSLADYGKLLVDHHIQEMSDMAVPATPWGGEPYAIPEPTGASLLVWGLAVLGLGRKRRA